MRGSGHQRTPHLFDHWSGVVARLRAARHLALFLDFDGTLVRLRRSPARVRLEKPMRQLLRRVARHPRVSVWIISGRRWADVRQRAGVAGVNYVGLHGWERKGRTRSAAEARRVLQRLRRLMAERLSALPGVWVEDKGFSFVVHYRGAARDVVQRARGVFQQLIKAPASRFRVLEGKKIWEVLPREVRGKGDAVHTLLAELPGRSLPVYVGDDTTDEAAFAALPRGLTVRVGRPRRTRARFRLRGPAEVRQFLERVEAEIA